MYPLDFGTFISIIEGIIQYCPNTIIKCLLKLGLREKDSLFFYRHFINIIFSRIMSIKSSFRGERKLCLKMHITNSLCRLPKIFLQ